MVPLRVRRSKSTFPQQLTGNKFSGYSVKKQKEMLCLQWILKAVRLLNTLLMHLQFSPVDG